jgi:hypothetical protein
LLTLAAGTAIVLIGARDSKTKHARTTGTERSRDLHAPRGDVVRDPRTGTRCEATGEAGIPNLHCTHTARGRYEAVFWDDELQLYGPGAEPMTPTYSFKWWSRLRP